MASLRNLRQIFELPEHLPEAGDREPHYQSMLRVIGTILDQLHASDIVIIEGFENFAVRFWSHAECEIRELSYADLLQAYQTLQNERTLLGTAEQGYYQDLLRALGYELECVRGRNLLLARAGDHYLLTFQRVESTGGAPRTRHALLDLADVEELLNRAHERRGTKQRRGLRRKRRDEETAREMTLPE